MRLAQINQEDELGARTVRRRLLADQTKPASQRRYAGTRDCFIKIVRDEGVGALFKGAGYNAIRTVCSAFTRVVAGKAIAAAA